MQPGLYQFIPRNGGRPRYAIVKANTRGVRLWFIDQVRARLVPAKASMQFGRFIPLVPGGNGLSVLGQRSPRTTLQGLAERRPEQFQPYYAGYDEHGGGLWYSHEREHGIGRDELHDPVVHHGGERLRREPTVVNGNKHPVVDAATNEPPGHLRAVEPAGNGSDRQPSRLDLFKLAELLDPNGKSGERGTVPRV